MNILIRISIIITIESAEPILYDAVEAILKCPSITSPMSFILPSLKLWEIKKVLIEGTNTIVIPEITPETVKGIMTLVIVWVELQPRSAAASM